MNDATRMILGRINPYMIVLGLFMFLFMGPFAMAAVGGVIGMLWCMFFWWAGLGTFLVGCGMGSSEEHEKYYGRDQKTIEELHTEKDLIQTMKEEFLEKQLKVAVHNYYKLLEIQKMRKFSREEEDAWEFSMWWQRNYPDEFAERMY